MRLARGRRLGARIRELRTEMGLPQEELAEISGLHRTYVGSVERGERNLTLASIETLARSLRTSVSDLFRGIG